MPCLIDYLLAWSLFRTTISDIDISTSSITTNTTNTIIVSENAKPTWIFLLYVAAPLGLFILVTLTVFPIKKAINSCKLAKLKRQTRVAALSFCEHSNREQSISTKNMYIKQDHDQNYQIQEVSAWLIELNLPQYLHNFVLNGYDSMDLIKGIIDIKQLLNIGINDEDHSAKLITSIKLLRVGLSHSAIVDSILNAKQDAVSEKHFDSNRNDKHCRETFAVKQNTHELEQWLNEIDAVQYLENFWLNGYESLGYIRDIHDIHDLEDIGIVDKDDQMKLMNAIIALNPAMLTFTCKKQAIVKCDEQYDKEVQIEGDVQI